MFKLKINKMKKIRNWLVKKLFGFELDLVKLQKNSFTQDSNIGLGGELND